MAVSKIYQDKAKSRAQDIRDLWDDIDAVWDDYAEQSDAEIEYYKDWPDSRLKKRVDQIISQSTSTNFQMYADPPLILRTRKRYLRNERMWNYFAEYFAYHGLTKFNEETGEYRPYTYEERFEISKFEEGKWVVYGIKFSPNVSTISLPIAEPDSVKGEVVTETPTQQELISEQVTPLSEEEQINQIINGNLSWQYTEEKLISRGEQIEKNWNPVYSCTEDPSYGKDISIKKPLTPEQKEKYNWDQIKLQWRQVNSQKGISDERLNQWIRKNLSNGWQEGDPIPSLKEIKVKFDESGVPVIQADTFDEAWIEVGKLGISRNQSQPFYWEEKITGKVTKYGYNFAPPDVYYNRTNLKSQDKGTYVNNMSLITGDKKMKELVMNEAGFEAEFAAMVKQTQLFLKLKPDGKMTPETRSLFAEKAAAIQKAKNEKARKEAEYKRTYELGYFVDSGKKHEHGKELVYYHYHNKTYSSHYINKTKTNNVEKIAAAGGDLDTPVYGLTNDEIIYLSFEARVQAIKNISDGTVVTEGDESTLLRLFKYVPPHEYSKMTQWISKNSYIVKNKIKSEIEHDYLRQEYNNLLADRYNYADKDDFKIMKKEVLNDSYSADSEAHNLPDKLLKTLEYDNKEYSEKTGNKIYHNSKNQQGYVSSLRINTLKVVANGYDVGDEDESTLIRYLTVLPDNPKVASAVRREIAVELLKPRTIDNYTRDFSLLRTLHDATHGPQYSQLRAALDEIFKDNGKLLADKIEDELKDPTSSSAHIEYFGEYGSKHAYKHLSNSQKIKFIKAIMKGLHEGNTDEQTILEVLESVGMPTTFVDKNNPSAVKAAREKEEKEKQEFYDMLNGGLYSITKSDILGSMHGEESTEAWRLLSTMNMDGSKARKQIADDPALDDMIRRIKISQMSDYDFQTLTIKQRKNYLTLLVDLNGSGWDQFWMWTGDAEESSVNKILKFTPKDQSIELSKWLYSKSGHYNDMKSAIDGAEYSQFHEALGILAETKRLEEELPSDQVKQLEESRKLAEENPNDPNALLEHQKNLNRVLGNKEKVETQHRKELEDIDLEKMQHKKVLPWGDVMIETKNGQDKKKISYRYSMDLKDQAKGGAQVKISFTKRITNVSTGEEISMTTKNLYFAPDEMIGVYFVSGLEGVAEQYELLKMPAVNFDRILNEDFKKDMWQMVEFAALLLSFMPLLRAGLSGLAKAIAVADATIMALSIIVNANKGSLPKWFIDFFSYIEAASMIFIFVGNPKKLIEAETELAKLDTWLKTLSDAEKAMPGFEDSVKMMREVLGQQINLAKSLEKADEATLRKLLKELEEAPIGKVDNTILISAVKKRLADITGGIVKSTDEIATVERKAADAAFNKGQARTLEQRKLAMAEEVVEKTEKSGGVLLEDGNRLTLKGPNEEVIARPIFASRKELAAWLSNNAKKRYSDAHSVDELDPSMHPWFFDEQGKLLHPENYPQLFDNGRPLTMSELFGSGGKFTENSGKFELLQNIGNFRSLGSKAPEDVALLIQRVEKTEGPLDVIALRQLLAKEGVELSDLTDEMLNEVMRKSRLYGEIPNATKRQQEFMREIMQRDLKGDIDEEILAKLMEYNKLNPQETKSIDELIDEFKTIELRPVEKGAWTKELFEALRPNRIYKVDNVLYHTDGEGKVIRVAGELNTGSKDSLIKAVKPISEATSAFNETGDLIQLKKQLKEIDELTAKMRSNIMKSAEAQAQVNRLIKSILTPQTGLAKMTILPGGEEFARLVAAAYHMIKKGVIDFQSYLLKLKAEQIIDDIGELTAEQKSILRDAFAKGKVLSNSNPALAADLERVIAQGDFNTMINLLDRVKDPAKLEKLLDVTPELGNLSDEAINGLLKMTDDELKALKGKNIEEIEELAKKKNSNIVVRSLDDVNGVGNDLLNYINSLINKNIRNSILELPEESRVVAQKYFNRINETPANYLSDYTVHLNDFDTWYANVFKSELFEAHHIIPKNVLRDNANLQSILDWARNNGKTWDFGDIDNGIMLQKRRKNSIGEVVGDHANHPEYDRQIREKINQIYTENSGNMSDAYDDFVEFVNDLKQQINTEVVEGNLIINTITIP